jgi:hypothetical protein
MKKTLFSTVIALPLALLCLFAWAGSAMPALGQATTAPAASADDVIYEDAGANSSATITQVKPNSETSLMTLQNVRRIRVKQGVLVIEWGGTATTLLPMQYVASMTVNKRNAATQPK